VAVNGKMDKTNVVYIHNSVIFHHLEEQIHAIFRKMEETRDHHVKQNKPDAEK
jgi:hypothetical protein